MITAGIDIGHEGVKVAILEANRIIGRAAFTIAGEVCAAAKAAYEQAMERQGMSAGVVDRIFSTGMGRENVTFAHGHSTEMLSQVVGAHWFFPGARTVIDIGAEGSRILRCDSRGNLTDFLLNDRCASGAGVFLETVASMLGLVVSEIGPLSLRSSRTLMLTTTCAVFAESEIVAEIHRGSKREDILAGVIESIVAKVTSVSRREGFEPDVVLTGGVARNAGVVQAFRRHLGMDIKVPEFPEITGALGAAILARDSMDER
ncbi:MAG: hypothetical protein HZB55_13245 [Deltaproteobacteria bacterium]|nr:hypothetical protein [Deltaproteobacteria bacterium]